MVIAVINEYKMLRNYYFFGKNIIKIEVKLELIVIIIMVCVRIQNDSTLNHPLGVVRGPSYQDNRRRNT